MVVCPSRQGPSCALRRGRSIEIDQDSSFARVPPIRYIELLINMGSLQGQRQNSCSFSSAVVCLVLQCWFLSGKGQTMGAPTPTIPATVNPCADPSSYLPGMVLDPATNATCAMTAYAYLTRFVGTQLSTTNCDTLPGFPNNTGATVKMIICRLPCRHVGMLLRWHEPHPSTMLGNVRQTD